MKIETLLNSNKVYEAYELALNSKEEDFDLVHLLFSLVENNLEKEFIIVHKKFNFDYLFMNTSFFNYFIKLGWINAFYYFFNNVNFEFITHDKTQVFESNSIKAINDAISNKQLEMLSFLLEIKEVEDFYLDGAFKLDIISSTYSNGNFEALSILIEKKFLLDITNYYNDKFHLEQIIKDTKIFKTKNSFKNF